MPTFELSDATGTYEIEAPNEQAALSAFQQHSGGPAAPQVGIGEDLMNVAKAAPGRAVAQLAGIPGDLLHLGMRALGDNLTPESAYGSNAIAKSLGSDYEAKREPGRLAQKAIDFAPALIGGPEALGAKLLTRIAAPVVASEAGRAVGGPVGEVAGALAGAGAATAGARRFQEMVNSRRAMPTGEQLVAKGSQGFDEARKMEVINNPSLAERTAADMRAALKDFDPQDASQKDVFRKVDMVEALGHPKAPTLTAQQRLELEMNGLPVPGAPPPQPFAMNELENIRKQLSTLKMSPDGATRAAAKAAQEALTKNQMGLTAADVVSGDAAKYAKTMRDAVGDYGAGKRSNIVTGKMDLAELNAGSAGSGAGPDNAYRQALKQIVRPINNTNMPTGKKFGFNDAEIDVARKGLMGGPIGNTARYIGKLAPTGSVSGVLGMGAGYGAAGPVGAVVLPAVGYLAKKIGDMSSKNAVKALDYLVRSRSPLAQQVAAALPPAIVSSLPAKSKLLLGSAAVQPLSVQQPANQRSY